MNIKKIGICALLAASLGLAGCFYGDRSWGGYPGYGYGYPAYSYAPAPAYYGGWGYHPWGHPWVHDGWHHPGWGGWHGGEFHHGGYAMARNYGGFHRGGR